MKSSNSKNLFEQLINWFKAYLKVYEKINPPTIYRVVESSINDDKERVFTIQLIGTAQIFQCTALGVVKDDKLLEGFSKQDVRNISYYANQELLAPKYAITSQIMDSQKTLFRLRYKNNSPIEKTAQEISLDKDLVKLLKSDDALLIGYVSASERISDIDKLMKIISLFCCFMDVYISLYLF